MPIETAIRIGELNPLWPLSTDPVSEGDNHLRIIKTSLNGTFPNAGTDQLQSTFPEIDDLVQNPPGNTLPFITTYTTPGVHAHSLQPGAKFVQVRMIGGGGGGGGGDASANTGIGANGGGGGYGESFLDVRDVIGDIALTVGAGGAFGVTNTSGLNGGDSLYNDGVNPLLTAGGGEGGVTGDGGENMNFGGIATGFNILSIPGADSANRRPSTEDSQFQNGHSFLGFARSLSKGDNRGEDNPGYGYGYGGMGGWSNSSPAANESGSTGGDGIIILLEYL